jgi:uncharacterized MAPEG superfamily protein
MTMDLWMLMASAALQWTLVMTAATTRLWVNGLLWGFGNRETPSKPVPKWADRVQRSSDNMQENLILLAVCVLVVHAAGAANDISALGAQVFFGSRVLHSLVFMAGIPFARTAAWFVSIVGLGMVVSALF